MGTYRFNFALQKENDTVESAKEEYDSPPTAKEAIEVVERVRQLGKESSLLPNKTHDDFDTTIDKVIEWLESKAGVGYRPDSNYDITKARKEFTYKGTVYRVDIRAGGKTSEGGWFL